MIKLHLQRSSWSLADQAIASIGGFVTNVILARQLSPSEYGVFAVLYGGMLGLQLVNGTLLFHPMSVRVVTANSADRSKLLQASVILIFALSAVLGGALALILLVLGYGALIPPALTCFLCWQVQEGFRRGLLYSLRHKAATLGDGVSYIGQGLAIAALAYAGGLTLATAFYAMAVTSALAAVVQTMQLGLRAEGPLRIRETAVDYWSIGGLWSLSGGLLSYGRVQVLPWTLALLHGPAAVGAFQAALNIVNLSNPIIISMGNIIPQTAAQASVLGRAHAWRAARNYGFIAMPPLLVFAAVILAAPELCLRVLYGPHSDYLDLSLVVRLLALAAIPTFLTEFAIAYLHGIVAVRSALAINAVGAVAAVVLAVPMIYMMGVVGGCLALLGASLARLLTCQILTTRAIHYGETGGPVGAPWTWRMKRAGAAHQERSS